MRRPDRVVKSSAVDRRRHPRVTSDLEARLANITEAIPPTARVVDLSMSGTLLSFAEPLGMIVDERVVVSVVPNDPIMLLGRVVRVARGIDFRTYVAVQFDDGQPNEEERLAELVACRLAAAHRDAQCSSAD